MKGSLFGLQYDVGKLNGSQVKLSNFQVTHAPLRGFICKVLIDVFKDNIKTRLR